MPTTKRVPGVLRNGGGQPADFAVRLAPPRTSAAAEVARAVLARSRAASGAG